jgi:hypothetical protein
MRKIRFAIPAIAVGLAIGSPGVAFAAPQPVAGCSNGYELMTVKSVLHTLAAPGFEESIKSFDVNGDGYLASRSFRMKAGRHSSTPPSSTWTTRSEDLLIASCACSLDRPHRAGKIAKVNRQRWTDIQPLRQ